MVNPEDILKFKTNEEILQETKFDEYKAIAILLNYLQETLNFYAVSIMFYDKVNRLYTPIYVYPAHLRENESYIKLNTDETGFKQSSGQTFTDVNYTLRSGDYTVADVKMNQDKGISLFAIPAISTGIYIGILNCYYYNETYPFGLTDLQKKVVAIVCEKIAGLKYQCQKLKKNAYEKVGENLQFIDDLDELLCTILQTCIDLGPKSLNYGFVGLVDEETKQIVVDKKHTIGWESALPGSHLKSSGRYDFHSGLTGKVLREQKHAFIHNVHKLDGKTASYSKSWDDVCSSLCVPIFIRAGQGKVKFLAVITLEATQYSSFSQSEVDALRESFLIYASGAIHEKLLIERQVGINETVDAILDEAEAKLNKVQVGDVLAHLCEKVLQICLDVGELNNGLIAIRSREDDGKFLIKAMSNKSQRRSNIRELESKSPLVETVMQIRKPEVITKIKSDKNETIWKDARERTTIIPIFHSTRFLGLLYFEHDKKASFSVNAKFDKILLVAERSAQTISTCSYQMFTRATLNKPYRIAGNDRQIKKVIQNASLFAHSPYPILIVGETGTGKELVAHRIHHDSERSNQPFVPIACTEVKDSLLESELFGHKKGAYTGADDDRVGKLENANNGTVFFDELGEMDLRLQAKLLRVIQEREVVRLGENAPRKINVRVIAATHRNLLDMVKEQKFREDLFHRFSVLILRLPPLRERKGDIPVLVQRFLQQQQAKLLQENALKLSRKAVNKLMEYRWPGNVRELENVVKRAIVFARGDHSTCIEESHILFLDEYFRDSGISTGEDDEAKAQRYIKELRQQNGNQQGTYRALGVSRVHVERIVGKKKWQRLAKEFKNRKHS